MAAPVGRRHFRLPVRLPAYAVHSGRRPRMSFTCSSEKDIATAFNVSRTPLREALARLVADGLADGIPYRGIFVRQITLRQVQDIYELRIAIEGLAAMLAAERGDPQRLDTLAELLAAMDREQASDDFGRAEAAQRTLPPHDRGRLRQCAPGRAAGRSLDLGDLEPHHGVVGDRTRPDQPRRASRDL